MSMIGVWGEEKSNALAYEYKKVTPDFLSLKKDLMNYTAEGILTSCTQTVIICLQKPEI